MDGSPDATNAATEGSGRHEAAEDHRERSRWPFVAAGGAGALYVGAGLYIVGRATGTTPPLLGVAVALVGVAGTAGGLLGWLYYGFVDGYWDHAASEASRRRHRVSMGLFLVTDVATFGALFAYYAFIRVGAWPPDHLPDLVGSLVLANTALLAASSVTLHLAHASLERGDRRRFLALLGATLALGVAFVGGQAYEYYEFVAGEGFTLSTGIFGSAFFGLTGLHGLHVTLGVVMLAIVFGRAVAGQYSTDRDTSVSTVSLYWHFIDVVWILLVVVLYVGSTVTVGAGG